MLPKPVKLYGFLYLHPGDCNFNNGNTCDWDQEKVDDNFDWVINNGPTKESSTGPDKGSDGGNYAYMQAGKRLLGEKAVLQLKDLKINSSQEECLSIEYYMYGRDIETLEIRQEYDKPLLFLTGPQGKGWKKAAGKLYLPTIAGQSLSTT
ncbi:hypothetical protein QZH41_009927, partial [Actinostola sp. cb2023]